MHGLFSIPLHIFMTAVAPPDTASLMRLECDLDGLARAHELSDRDARTLKDTLVEPFRQEGQAFGPDTLEWMLLLTRRLVALPPGVVSAGAQMQWTTLQLGRYTSDLTAQQYVGLVREQIERAGSPEPLPIAVPLRAPYLVDDEEEARATAHQRALPLRIRRKGSHRGMRRPRGRR